MFRKLLIEFKMDQPSLTPLKGTGAALLINTSIDNSSSGVKAPRQTSKQPKQGNNTSAIDFEAKTEATGQ